MEQVNKRSKCVSPSHTAPGPSSPSWCLLHGVAYALSVSLILSLSIFFKFKLITLYWIWSDSDWIFNFSHLSASEWYYLILNILLFLFYDSLITVNNPDKQILRFYIPYVFKPGFRYHNLQEASLTTGLGFLFFVCAPLANSVAVSIAWNACCLCLIIWATGLWARLAACSGLVSQNPALCLTHSINGLECIWFISFYKGSSESSWKMCAMNKLCMDLNTFFVPK